VFHCGGETDFDNGYRWLAPWSEIGAGRVVILPAGRRFAGGRWARATVHPLLSDEVPLAEVLRSALGPHRDELRRYPLYISVDKDVLTAQDAVVNWDSGLLGLDQALAILEAFLAAAEGRLVGGDILGDWSPVRLGHRLNRLCARLDHPSPEPDPADAACCNRRANVALLHALLPEVADGPCQQADGIRASRNGAEQVRDTKKGTVAACQHPDEEPFRQRDCGWIVPA
jgi:hypothetical protein